MSKLEERLASRIGSAAGDQGDGAAAQPGGQATQEKPPEVAQKGRGAAGGTTPAPEPTKSRKSAQGGAQGRAQGRAGGAGTGGDAPEGAEQPPALSERARKEWVWRLGNAARKAASDARRAEQSAADWQELVNEARTSGVPDHLLIAAAASVNLELPN